MAAAVTKSEFWTRNAAKIAPVVEAHRNDPPKTGFVPLPGGIKGGIAKVTFCGFGRNDNGEYFRAEAEVVEPKTLNGVPLTGMKTSKVAVLMDTDHEASVVAVMDMLKLLGCEFPAGTVVDPGAIGAAITGANPPVCIRFSTRESPPAPNPKKPGEMYPARVWEDWHGVVAGYNPTATPVPSTNGNGYHAPAPKTADPAPWSEAKPATTPTPEVAARVGPTTFPLTNTYRDDEDLDALGARAASDPPAADRLRELAISAGYTKDQVEDSDSWTTVVEWIKGGGPKVEADADPVMPVEGNLCWYKAPDPKSPGTFRARKCFTIKTVKPRKGTVDLVQVDDKSRKYADVPFADIEHQE